MKEQVPFKLCVVCGGRLPLGAGAERCPKCLLMLGLEPNSGLSDGDISAVSDADALRVAAGEIAPLEIPATEEAPGRYTVLEEFGKGGMGRVFLVYDEHLGRDVALKELLPDQGNGSTPVAARHSKDMVARFLREAKITGQLEHPSITPVHELGRRADGTLYYTMKLVRGRTLSEAIKSAANFGERLTLLPHFVDLCNAIAYAHSRGVLHRDIKPSNVMIGDYGETVIIDWGLAKVKRHQHEESRGGARVDADLGYTRLGQAMGTPAYMAPEQARGDSRAVDERSDVYSLGAVLFEILAGTSSAQGIAADQLIHHVINGELRRVSEFEPSCPDDLVSFVEKAMALDRDSRYPSAKVLGEAVQTWKPKARPSRMLRGLLYAVAATALILTFATLGLNRYYAMILHGMQDQIREEGGMTEPGDYESPREAEAQSADKSGADLSVYGFLASIDKLYPGVADNVSADWDLLTLSASPSAITAEERRKIELALMELTPVLEQLVHVASLPPSTGAEIVKAMELDSGSPLDAVDPKIITCLDLARALRLRAALHWRDGLYDRALGDLESIVKLSLHLKDGPGMIGMAVGGGVAQIAVENLNLWLEHDSLPPEAAENFMKLLNLAKARQPTVNAYNGERYLRLWMSRALDRGERRLSKNAENTIGYLSHVLNTSLLRWRRHREEIFYLKAMDASMEAHGLPWFQGRHAWDALEAETNSYASLRRPALLSNFVRTYQMQAEHEAWIDVAMVSFAAAGYRSDHGAYPDSVALLVPEYLPTWPVDVFDGQPLRYARTGDAFTVYSVGVDGVDDGGKITGEDGSDLGWQVGGEA